LNISHNNSFILTHKRTSIEKKQKQMKIILRLIKTTFVRFFFIIIKFSPMKN